MFVATFLFAIPITLPTPSPRRHLHHVQGVCLQLHGHHASRWKETPKIKKNARNMTVASPWLGYIAPPAFICCKDHGQGVAPWLHEPRGGAWGGFRGRVGHISEDLVVGLRELGRGCLRQELGDPNFMGQKGLPRLIWGETGQDRPTQLLQDPGWGEFLLGFAPNPPSNDARG